MKKFKYIFGAFLLAGSVASCNFLDREPMDFGDENAYYKTVDDLELAVNDFYQILPKMEYLWGGPYEDDNTSDNQCGNWPNNMFYPGDKKTVQQANSEWKFVNLRGINFFINKTKEQMDAGAITGTKEFIDHYWGEGFFFRAYEHFRLLRNYGDAPILEVMLPDDEATLAQASKRRPRNEVARFIIEDLKRAEELMMENAPAEGRLSKDAARLLRARVALYEATWEKYHANTAFVPGNPKWVGASMYPDFQFKAGDAQKEIEYFLDEAIEAADLVASHRALDDDYIAMFNRLTPFSSNDEVILARYYQMGILSHSASNYLGRTGGGTGFTRALVNTFLMKNGLPIYADGSNYGGDTYMLDEMKDRDERLVNSVKIAGSDIETVQGPDGTLVNDTIYYYRPQLTLSGNEASPTGYELKKWVSNEPGQQEQGQGTSATPILRAAEAYLIYLEAYYERHGNLGGNCDRYWTELRRRAGVDTDYNKTIAATDLSKENDLAVYSKGIEVDKTLYNIRRERRCELLGEGMRLDDLKRWRALDNMKDYQVEGMNLWDEMYKMYDNGALNGVVSPSGVSNYIRPLQKTSTSVAYNGYNFPKPHYLEPIPISEFLLTVDGSGNSTLYQNPGWPTKSDGIADYSYDCD